MLAIKNGLKSVWRSPGKTCVFFALLLVLTVVLAVGMCVYSAVDGYLLECEQYYQTIAELEYIGASYDDTTCYDETLAELILDGQLDTAALAALPGVEAWEPNRSALGTVAGYTGGESSSYDADSAILIVRNLSWQEDAGAYMGMIDTCLYSARDRTGQLIFISAGQLDLEQSRTYVFAGRYIAGSNSYVWLEPEQMQIVRQGQTCTLEACAPVAAQGLAGDSLYLQAAQALSARRQGVRVQLTSDVACFRPFQLQELTLREGRFYTSQEAADGARVCLISSQMADAMGIQAGQTIELSLRFPRCGLYMLSTAEAAAAEQYTVVGVYHKTQRYRDWIFAPDSSAFDADPCPTGYQVGQFRLENRRAQTFYTAAEALLPAGFRLTVYDEGYAAASACFWELLRVARIFLAICALVIAAVLALYGYLFVFRQRQAAQTMLALGSGRAHVYGYFTAATGVVTVAAAAVGALIGRFLERWALDFIVAFAQRYAAADLRYSSSSLGLPKTLPFAPQAQPQLYVLAAGVMVAASVVSCALFTGAALRRPRGKKKTAKTAARRNKTAARGDARSTSRSYLLLSVQRGGMRTVSVVALALMVSVFLGLLSGTSDTFRDQLAQLETDTAIRGYASDITGLQMQRLTLGAGPLQALYDSGAADTLDVGGSIGYYRLEGVVRDENGALGQVEPVTLMDVDEEGNRFPYQPLGNATGFIPALRQQMRRQPQLEAVTSISGAAQFYYTPSPEITWLEGYDESCMQQYGKEICVAPQAMLEREAIQLGSIIRLFVYRETMDGGMYFERDLKVVGSYASGSVQQTIYQPLEKPFPLDEANGASVDLWEYTCTLEKYPRLRPPVTVVSEENAAAEPFVADYLSQDAVGTCTMLYAGYSLEMLQQPGSAVCVCSRQFLELYYPELLIKVDPWNKQTLAITGPSGIEREYTLIGYFEKTRPQMAQIYCSARSEDARGEYLASVFFDSAVFSVSDAARADALREALEQAGFAEANTASAARSYAVVDDKSYYAMRSSLTRQMQYLDTLYQCLYVLTGLIALAAAWQTVGFRKQEIAIMRGLGTRRRRIFGLFLGEQLALVLLGCALGTGLWAALGGAMKPLYAGVLGAFIGCWAAGAAANIVAQLRTDAMSLLSAPE